MLALAFVGVFIAGASAGCLIALCARGFAQNSGEYDRAMSGYSTN